MKANYFYLSICLTVFTFFSSVSTHQVKSQSVVTDYRKDSLQFKMYTRLYLDHRLTVDSVIVKNVFCDFCSDAQIAFLSQEAFRQTTREQYNPKYRKPGEHRITLYVRFSKEDFKKIDN